MEIQERPVGDAVPGYRTIAETARLLGISVGATYSRLYRSRLPVIKAGRTLLLPVDTVMRLFNETREYTRGK